MRFLDTNVVMRYVTADDPLKAQACAELFQRVQRGEEALLTSEAVVAEAVYILSARTPGYRLDRHEIRDRLGAILRLRGLQVPEKQVCLRALDVYAAYPRLDYEDALAVAHMEHEGITEIVSYDSDSDRIPHLERVEP